MIEDVERAKGRLLSRLLLTKSDLQGTNKNYLEKEIKTQLEEIQNKVEILIKSLISK